MHAVRITVICDECLRIEYAPGGRFNDHPSLFAIHGPGGSLPISDPRRSVRTFRADDSGGPFGMPAPSPQRTHVLETARVRLEYTPDGRPPHAGNMRALVRHNRAPADVPRAAGCVLWTPGMQNRHNLGGTLSTLDGVRGPTPLGDGLLSRDGWFVVDDSRRHLLVDGWARSRESEGLGDNVDWYLFAYGDDYGAALRALTVIGGSVPLPRRSAMGSWFSRYWPYTSAEFRGIVDEYQTHGFPLDVMVLDMDWHREGWTGWSFNRDLLPDAEDLISWMHEHGLAVTLNLHPADGVGPHEDRYAPFMRAVGREPDGSRLPFDAGDRKYMEALFEQVLAPLEQRPDDSGAQRRDGASGVDFWWLDWQQDVFTRSIPGLTNLRWLNTLFYRHSARALGTLGREDVGRRGIGFSRWPGDHDGGWGDHRHPVHFSGDAHTGWPMLAFQVPFTAAAGNVGCFFWSHDIGGHFGPRFEETTARWVQFGALSPVLRLHSARTASLDRRPWTYEARFCDSMLSAFRLRSALFPYIYSAAAQGCRDSMPLLRPMYLESPSEERAYLTPGQYMLGEDVIAAPIVSPGHGERCVGTQYVWFPGADWSRTDGPVCAWHDWFTGERHEPGTEIIAAAGIDRMPLFVRAGTPVATRPPTMRMASDPLTELVVRCYPGEPGRSAERVLYEDDGESLAYLRGGCARTAMTAHWHGAAGKAGNVERGEVEIAGAIGRFSGQPERRRIILELGGVEVVSAARVNGADCGVEAVDREGQDLYRLDSGDVSVAQGCRFSFEFVRSAGPRAGVESRSRLLEEAIGTKGSAAGLKDAVLNAIANQDADTTRRVLEIGAGIGAVKDDTGSVRLVDSMGWIEGAATDVSVLDRSGSGERVTARERVRMVRTGAGPACAASIRMPEAPLAQPPLGLRASRLVRVGFVVNQKLLWMESVHTSILAPLQRWEAVGPFDWDWRRSITDQVFAPELPGSVRWREFSGSGGERAAWRSTSSGPRWAVDLRATFPGRAGLAYVRTCIVSPRAQSAALHFDSGDKLEAWLNGERVYSQDGFDTHAAAVGLARVGLSSGRNTLMVKTSDGGGGWGFTLAIDGECEVAVDAVDSDNDPAAVVETDIAE